MEVFAYEEIAAILEMSTALRIILIASIPLAIIQITLMITALVSVTRKPVPNKEKTGWILLIVLVGIIGPIFYFAVGSKELDEEAARLLNKEL
jgi:uncharacterized membrane protein YhaH (DUF805 family)